MIILLLAIYVQVTYNNFLRLLRTNLFDILNFGDFVIISCGDNT